MDTTESKISGPSTEDQHGVSHTISDESPADHLTS